MKLFYIVMMIFVISPIFSEDIRAFSRLNHSQIFDIAGSEKLPHRIFYKPSRGIHAKWFDIVKQGDLKSIIRFVQDGQDIEVKDTASLGQTALLWAAFIGYLDIVQYFVEELNANLFASDRTGISGAFSSAILGGHIEVISYLYDCMKHQIDIDTKDQYNDKTLLMYAVENDRMEAVKFLLQKSGNVNLFSSKLNANALTFAIKNKNTVMIQLLKEYGAEEYQHQFYFRK